MPNTHKEYHKLISEVEEIPDNIPEIMEAFKEKFQSLLDFLEEKGHEPKVIYGCIHRCD